MIYKRKEELVSTFQYDGDLRGKNGYYVPDWAVQLHELGQLYYDKGTDGREPCELFFENSNGLYHVAVNDYIVKDNEGNISVVPAEKFKEKYEKVVKH